MTRLLALAVLAAALAAPAAAQYATGFGGSGVVLTTVADVADDGGTVVTGAFASSTIAIGNATLSPVGSRDAFVAAFDDAGDPRWAFSFGGAGLDGGTAVAAAPGGEVCVAGLFEGVVDVDPTMGELLLQSAGLPSNPIQSGFVARYRPDGTPVYARALFGGNSDQFASSAFVDAQGRCVVGGGFQGTLDLGDGGTLVSDGPDGYVLRFEADGSASALAHVTGPATTRLTALGQGGPDGRFCAAGSFVGTTAFGPDPEDTLTAPGLASYVACYDADGTLAFARPVFDTIDVTGVAVDAAGRASLAGRFFGSITADGAELSSAGLQDGFVTAYDADGALRFAHAFGGSGTDTAVDLAADAAGDLYLAGQFSGTVDLDPSPGEAVLSSRGETDVFVARLGLGGALRELQHGGGADDDIPFSAVFHPDGALTLAGTYRGNATFDVGATAATLPLFAGSGAGFIVQTRFAGGVDVEGAPGAGVGLSVAPNPSAGDAAVRLALGAPGEAAVAVHDALGRRVAELHHGLLGAGDHAFRLPTLAPGLYVARAVTAGGAPLVRPFSVVR